MKLTIFHYFSPSDPLLATKSSIFLNVEFFFICVLHIVSYSVNKISHKVFETITDAATEVSLKENSDSANE